MEFVQWGGVANVFLVMGSENSLETTDFTNPGVWALIY